MMAPTVVLGTDGEVELVLGSAGSNRIRSAILQVIVGVVDHGLHAHDAVLAPRAHFEDGVVYAEPGIDVDALRGAGREVRRLPRPQPVLRRRAGRRARPGHRRALGRRRSAPRRRRGGCVSARGGGRARRARGAGDERLRQRGARPLPRHAQRRRPRRAADAARHRRRPRLLQRPAAGRHHERPAHHRARERARPRAKPAKAQLRLAAGRQPVFSYRVRTEDGGVAWSDDSARQPAGPLQAGQAHARRGQGPLPPGALVTPASALQQSRFRRGRPRNARW